MEEKKAKFREGVTPRGILILAGKNSKNNEELVAQVEKEEFVFHTALPGSPFVNLKGETKKEDLKYAAIFCARYSKDWRDNKKDVLIHVFKGKDIYKGKTMKEGTFGIKKFSKILVKKKEIEDFLYQKV
jgi:predicted ribosome quality control (RQC) complex YloA/Tae2 family protein